MRTKTLASLAVASVFLSASPAFADYREDAYITTLYSDATYTTVVGHIYPSCGYNYVQYTLEGSNSNYPVDEFYCTCTRYGCEPL